MKKSEHRHNYYLEQLVERLEEIDERRNRVHWILKDGIWHRNYSTEKHKLADLILAYYDGTAVPVELKGSKDKKDKAIEQLKSSYWFIKKVLNLECYFGKFVVYGDNKYEYETIMFRRRQTDGWK